MNFEELQGLVLDWADDKDLLHEENADRQFMKFIEEVFEFNVEMEKHLSGEIQFENWYEKALYRGDIRRSGIPPYPILYMELEMGDIFVTLIILCKQLDISPVDCLQKAYKKISKRKGKTIDGVFVKAEDL